MNWLTVASSVFCIPMVMLFTEKHGRLDLDLAHNQSQSGIPHGDTAPYNNAIINSDVTDAEDVTRPLLRPR